MAAILDPETIKLGLAGAGVLLANYFIARNASKTKADSSEVTAVHNRVNALTELCETQQKSIDRLNGELERCHAHRDVLIVERDKLSQQLVMMLLEKDRKK